MARRGNGATKGSRTRGKVYGKGGKVVTARALRLGYAPKKLYTASGKSTTLGSALTLSAYRTAASPAVQQRVEYLNKRELHDQARAFLRFAGNRPQAAERIAINLVAQQLRGVEGGIQDRNAVYRAFEYWDMIDFADEIDDEWLYY